jgi:transcriptional regulator with XRE-family HTH domain
MGRRSDERWRERDRSGLSYPYVSQLENGDREPSLDALGKLAAAFQVPVEVLLKPVDGTESPAAEARWLPNPGYAAPSRAQPRQSSRSHRRRAELDVAISDAYDALQGLAPEDRIEAAGALLARCLREVGRPS